MNLIQKLTLAFIIIFPYVAMMYLIKNFTEHYEFVLNRLDVSMQNSYYLGCAETKLVSYKVCKQRSKERI